MPSHRGAVVVAAGLIAVIGTFGAAQEKKGQAKDDGGEKTALARYQELNQQYTAAQNAFIAAMYKAKNATELHEAQGLYPSPSEFAGQFLELAKSAPGSGVALSSLSWIVSVSPGSAAAEEAYAILARDHSNDKRLHVLFGYLIDWPTRAGEEMLRSVLEKSTVRENRAQACAILARVVAAKARREGAPGAGADASHPAHDEASALLTTLADEYGDLKSASGKTYGEISRADRARLGPPTANRRRRDGDVRIEVGEPAPEIAARNTQGQPMRLSAHRGSVVVLSFWGQWCPWCHGIFPFGQSLKYRFGDKPVVLLGVNTDGDLEQVRRLMTREQITWKSFWDGNPRGPITTSYQVERHPATFVLDHNGVIRYKMTGQVDEQAIQRAVDTLLAERAADPKATEAAPKAVKKKAR